MVSQTEFANLQRDVEKLERSCCCGGSSITGGCCYFEVTYAELHAQMTAGTLIKGSLYKITDRGDAGIFLNAISETELNAEGARLMVIPNHSSIQDVWNVNNENAIGDKYVWYGHVFVNLTGVVGTDPVTDNVNWQLIPKDNYTDEYTLEPFGVLYDLDNDWIARQWDYHGNIFGVPYDWNQAFGYTFGIGDNNPVNVSDWWLADNATSALYNNDCYGVWNNYDLDHIHDNHIPGGIFGNTVGIQIIYNTNQGDISNNIHADVYNNSNNGKIDSNYIGADGGFTDHIGIHHNSNNGDIIGNYMFAESAGGITYNSNGGDINSNGTINISSPRLIIHNSNNGGITGNQTSGNTGIVYNSNNGTIDSVTESAGPISIFNNINNGTIGPGAYAADITDVIVDK